MNADGLKKQARQGLLWGGGFRAFHIGLQFGLTLILARLLSPSDYGTYSVVAGIVGFLNAVSFENFTRYILQVRDDNQIHYQDHFTAAVGIQFIICLLTNLVAVVLRWVPSYAEIAGYIHVLSPIILLSSVGGYHYICLEKQLNWPRYRTLQSIGVLMTAIIVLVVACMGYGVLALLIGPSIKYIPPIFDLFFVQKWKPTWQFSWTKYQTAFFFGLNRLASTANVKIRAVVESNWLLQLIGLANLGLMNRALGLSQLINTELSTIIGQSLYPILTRIEPRSDRYRDASALLFQGTTWILLPMCVLASLLAHPIVATLYGDRWLSSVEFVPMTMLAGMAAALGRIAYQLVLASCNERSCVIYDFVRLVLTVIALAIWPLHNSLQVYLWSTVIAEVVSTAALIVWLCESNAANASMLFERMAPAFVATGAALLTAIPAWGRFGEMTLFSPMAIATACGFIIVYGVTLIAFFPALTQNLVQVVPFLQRVKLFRAISPSRVD